MMFCPYEKKNVRDKPGRYELQKSKAEALPYEIL